MALVTVMLRNLAVLVPIWQGTWGVFAVLSVYWFENFCSGLAQHRKLQDLERFVAQPGAGFAPSAFFALHYGLFTAVHGVLVLVFFGLIEGGLHGEHAGWWISVLLVAAMQVVDYRVQWRGGAGWVHTSAARLIVEPYARVAVLQVVVIAGGWLALSSSQPRTILLVFAALKFAAEVGTTLIWQRLPVRGPRRGAA